MRCDEVQERFVDLLYEDRGTPPASSELKAHISSCPSCRRELEELKYVRATLKAWEDEPPLRPVLVPASDRSNLAPRFKAWRLLRYAAVAALVVLAFLALANAEFTWNKSGFVFSTHLLTRPEPGSDYYTKAEVLDLLKRVSDDSESRMIETNYLMIQRMMDTLEQERWRDLRYFRNTSSRNPARN